MANPSQAAQSSKIINAAAPDFEAKIGIELGSGLGQFAEHIEGAISIPYAELPGFPESEVDGHGNRLVFGYVNGVGVMCLQGRIHLYEGAHHMESMKTMIRTLRLCGAETFMATNAAGSFHEHIPPGSLVAINDHINFNPMVPLTGPNDDEFGPRFVAMDNAYDIELRNQLTASAKSLNFDLHEGIYIGVQGPCFETPAEIRAYRTLGADVIGMSTVPNVIVARHCGLKVAVISVITNYVSGMSEVSLSHKETVTQANKASDKLTSLLRDFISKSNDK